MVVGILVKGAKGAKRVIGKRKPKG